MLVALEEAEELDDAWMVDPPHDLNLFENVGALGWVSSGEREIHHALEVERTKTRGIEEASSLDVKRGRYDQSDVYHPRQHMDAGQRRRRV